MKEKLQPIEAGIRNQPWAYMLWELMVREGGKSSSGMEAKFGELKPNGEDAPLEVEVELKVNGVAVSFSTAINNIWERAIRQYDSDVLKTSKDLVKGTRLHRLVEIMERFEWELETELEQLVKTDSNHE